MSKITQTEMKGDERLVVLYFLSTMKLNPDSPDATQDFVPFECFGANAADCRKFTGLTKERMFAAVERLNAQGAAITIGAAGEKSKAGPLGGER